MTLSTSHAELADWITAGGGHVHCGLDLVRQCGPNERGVFASADIAVGELLLCVPRSRVLSPSSSLPHSILSSAQFVSLPAVVRTALALLAEQARGARSLFHAYLGTLPVEYPTPDRWSIEERAALDGTAAGNELARGSAEKVLWRLEVASMVTSATDVWRGGVTEDAFLDAVAGPTEK